MSSSDEDIKLLYLLSGSSDVLPSSYLKLRSYLNVHLSNLADQQNLKLLKSFRNRNKTCPYCYTPWSGETTSFKLLPSKKRGKGKKAQNANLKLNEVNEPRNTLVLKCKVCTKKSSFSLVKKRYVEEKPKEENVEFRKKKKKKDKSCGLNVNLLKPDSHPPEVLFVKKKKRVQESGNEKPEHSQGVQAKSKKQTPISKSNLPLAKENTKKLVLNPFASQNPQGSSGKQNRKLERLKQAVKQDKNLVKKTLKDFLTLV